MLSLLSYHLLQDSLRDVWFGDCAVVSKLGDIDAFRRIIFADTAIVLACQPAESADATNLYVDPTEAPRGHAAEMTRRLNECNRSPQSSQRYRGDNTT
jgi:hypothetical protein